MKILDEATIYNLINIMKFDDKEIGKFQDTQLQTFLIFINFLEKEKLSIKEINNTLTVDDLLYSQYYWFTMFKKRYYEVYGHDEGLEQQAFNMLENMSTCLENGVDWTIVERIENGSIVL